jgi:hypothetical protein
MEFRWRSTFPDRGHLQGLASEAARWGWILAEVMVAPYLRWPAGSRSWVQSLRRFAARRAGGASGVKPWGLVVGVSHPAEVKPRTQA